MTYACADTAVLAGLRETMSARVAELIAVADRTMRHEFNLLGSGWYVLACFAAAFGVLVLLLRRPKASQPA